MNNTIKLAVASALLAAASTASAAGGIVAGDWTLDIGGIVNMYATRTSFSGTGATGPLSIGSGTGTTTTNLITGLLPNYLTVGGKTRQNDLDVTFLISMQPGAATRTSLSAGSSTNQENRQQFVTFGDASWGSVKLGKDLGIYASDAILNDMTLLGVGSGAGSLHGTTTLGGIGAGYIYADWKNQISYTSPNFNGFSFTGGITQAWNQQNLLDLLPFSAAATAAKSPAFEGKIAYAFAGDVSGKVWASAISQKNDGVDNTNAALSTTNTVAAADVSSTTTAWDIGANVNMAGFGLTGYYGDGKGIGQTLQFNGGLDAMGQKRDSRQYYVQGTYVLPGVGTKLGVSYGESKLDGNVANDDFNSIKDSMIVVGAYHPLTKHLNLVAEYAESEQKFDSVSGSDTKGKAKTVSLGAILFF